jgi:hypothetical protein
MVTRANMAYRDAVAIMTGKDSRLTTTLDRILGGAILGAVLVGGPSALALIGPKNELLKYGQAQIDNLLPSLKGLSVPNRTRRIHAAHCLIVVTSFVEASQAALQLIGHGTASLSDADLVQLLVPRQGTTSGAERPLMELLAKTGIPLPEPHRSFESHMLVLHDYYQAVAAQLPSYLSALSVWDVLNETQRGRLEEIARSEVPRWSLENYEAAYRRLAGEVPEFAFWALNLVIGGSGVEVAETVRREGKNLQDLVAHTGKDFRVGLAAVESALSALTKGLSQPTIRWRTSLDRMASYELARPILDPGDELVEVSAPTVGQGYLDPLFRVAEWSPSSHPSVESWWSSHPVRDNLGEYLAAYLTSPKSVRSPMLILGHPGAGKSMLSRVLAARLPGNAYIPVRVVLRDVTASARVDAQIEEGVRNMIHEAVSWPEFVGSQPSALPVVILDGFDELLQATGISQSNYLEEVLRFQELEYAQGRAVAIIVTTRTTVANRARIPTGAVMVKLEPFSDTQVDQWIDIWNASNAEAFATRNVASLNRHAVKRHADLASQPILLMMLAIYDADDNALTRDTDLLSRAQLYDRLLTRFLRREVLKSGKSLSEIALTNSVEMEMYDLSLIALAMFNRGKQLIDERSLDDDLAALGNTPDDRRTRSTLVPPLTHAEKAVGRFFFVHTSEAWDDGKSFGRHEYGPRAGVGRTFEFLHATFGEYLVARVAVRLLEEIDQPLENALPWQRGKEGSGAGLLETLFSFQPLCKRQQVVSFVGELLNSHPAKDRIRGVLVWQVRRVGWDIPSIAHPGYRPLDIDVPARVGIFSVNLVLLLACLQGQVSVQSLSVDAQDAKHWWRSKALLWQASLDHESWVGLTRMLRLSSNGIDDLVYRLEPVPGDTPYQWYEDDQVRQCQTPERWKDSPWPGPERLEQQQLGNELSVDWDNHRTVCAIGTFAERLGPVVSTAYAYPGEGMIMELGPVGLGGRLGASILLSVNSVHNENAQVMEAAYRRATALITSQRGEVDARLIHYVLRNSSLDFNQLSSPCVEELLRAALDYGPRTSSEIFYADCVSLGCRLYHRHPSEGLDHAAEAWSRLDPPHLVDHEPEVLLQLLLQLSDLDIPVWVVAAEYGSLQTWFDRLPILDIADRNPALGMGTLRVAMHHGLQEWAGSTGLSVAAVMPPMYYERLTPAQLAFLLVSTAHYLKEFGTKDESGAEVDIRIATMHRLLLGWRTSRKSELDIRSLVQRASSAGATLNEVQMLWPPEWSPVELSLLHLRA